MDNGDARAQEHAEIVEIPQPFLCVEYANMQIVPRIWHTDCYTDSYNLTITCSAQVCQ